MEVFQMPGFKRIFYLDVFKKEFLEATDHEDRYRYWLLQKLTILEEYGKKALLLGQFEKLNHEEVDLYSIRYPHSKLNPRVIYFYVDGDDIVLSTAFKEKSSNDYKRGIRKAKERYKLLQS